MQNILVTGGAGFIGSHLVDMLLAMHMRVVILDALTYAGSMQNLVHASKNSRYKFIHGNICDSELSAQILDEYNIDTVFHLAAESHVDNSIHSPGKFIETNIVGTYNMLSTSLKYWEKMNKPNNFRFMHVSTDEVFGQLAVDGPPFNEESNYRPNSPYAASKAASDLLVRSWFHTYKFPAIITNTSNNFGPRQHSEKLIPKIIDSALSGKSIPLYGDGQNIRDWIYVQDHCQGIILAAKHGKMGETYCFGGNNEFSNNKLTVMICRILDHLVPNGKPYEESIIYVANRQGHDFRYAIDSYKAYAALGWKYVNNFADNLKTTVVYSKNRLTQVT